MLTRCSFKLSVVVAATAVLLTQGCKKESASQPVPAQAEEAAAASAEQLFYEALDAAYIEANELLAQAQTNDAVAVFVTLQRDTRFEMFRDRIAGESFRFQIFAGQTDSVCEHVLQACRSGEVAIAQVGLQVLLPHLHETSGSDAAYDFATAVVAIPGIDAELVRLATEWRFFTALNAGDMPQARDALAVILKTAPPAATTTLLANAFDQLISASRLDDLESLHAQVAAAGGTEEARTHLLKVTAIRLAAGRGNWESMSALFKIAAQELPDADLQRLLYQIFPTVRKAGRLDIVDACAEEVIFKQSAKSAASAQAARFWAESAMATNRAAFPERLDALISAKIPARTVSGLFTRYFYDVINDTAVLKALLPVASRLLADADADADTAKMIKTMQLDGSFVLEDYDLAVSYLEAGIPDRDDAWHKMAISKVKAHRALKANNPREAVEYFRVFMTCIDDVKDDDTVDPSTGIQHTKDMLRGRNAKRIADILQAIPDEEGAAKARAEAADYYQKAIDSITDEDARKIILAEAGDLLK